MRDCACRLGGVAGSQQGPRGDRSLWDLPAYLLPRVSALLVPIRAPSRLRVVGDGRCRATKQPSPVAARPLLLPPSASTTAKQPCGVGLSFASNRTSQLTATLRLAPRRPWGRSWFSSSTHQCGFSTILCQFRSCILDIFASMNESVYHTWPA